MYSRALKDWVSRLDFSFPRVAVCVYICIRFYLTVMTMMKKKIIIQDWLPVEFWSTTPVYIEWSRSSHVGLNLTAEYKFADDSFCGSREAEKLEGEIHAGYSAKFSFALNHYYQQKCTYIIESPPNRDLVIQIESSQTSEFFCVLVLFLSEKKGLLFKI